LLDATLFHGDITTFLYIFYCIIHASLVTY
jgi:hypothetical protein